MNTNLFKITMLIVMASACLLFSGCFMTDGEHFLWF